MTLAEIQTEFNESPCVATLTQGQLFHLIAKLLFGSGSMTLADIQAVFDESPCLGTLTTGQLWQLFVGNSGGGSGNVMFLATTPATSVSNPPPDPTQGAIAYIADSGAFIGWNVTNQEWDL